MKDIIIGDINGDQSTELVISLTDRVVRTYKWVSCLGEEAQAGRLVQSPLAPHLATHVDTRYHC